MANRTKLTNHARADFLRVLRETGNISMAARRIGMSRRYLYQVKARDEALSQACDDAVAEAADALYGEARRRPVEGVAEPLIIRGKVCGEIRRYSDRLLEFLLKAHRPEKYRIVGRPGADIVRAYSRARGS
jgi:hypothetical protein